jgi:hypothetical protein
MKKMSTLLASASIATLAVLTGAADCDTGGGVAVSCETDADCADELENTVCDLDVGVCVAPADEVCAADADCDLANPDSPSTVTDCSADADCDEAGGEVCVADGVNVTYCVLADSDAPGESCTDLDFVSASIDGKDVCVVSSGQSCTDGQCG